MALAKENDEKNSSILKSQKENNSINIHKKKNYIIKTKTETKADSVISKNLGQCRKIGHNRELITAELSSIQVKELISDPDILYIEEDFFVTANESGAFEINGDTEWNIETIGAKEAHLMGYLGTGVKVAVLDSGMDKWLQGNLSEGVDLIMKNGKLDVDDLTGHGTAISSIISAPFGNADLLGVAPNAELTAVKVLDSQNSSPISRIIEGIDWCIQNDIDVINMSFGTSNYSIALKEKIQEATQEGLIIVASAGNNGSNGGLQYPARYDNVIAVASIGTDMQRVDSSATGEGLSVSAPGDQIRTLGLFGGESIVTGTSIATAHVTGAVAILLDKIPNASPEVINALIQASAIPLGKSTEYGAGLIDISYALEICDEFLENFDNSDWQLPSNTSIVNDMSDDVDYVNGL